MRIDGKQIAQTILSDLTGRVNRLKKQGITPHLVIILVGDDPASKAYTDQKKIKGKEIGVEVEIYHLPITARTEEVIGRIKDFNGNPIVHGIIVQRPLPDYMDSSAVDRAIDPKKDVDGFHPQTKFQMPLPQTAVKILGSVEKDLRKKKIVVIGKGETGGRPVIARLRTMNIEPTIIDSKTQNPEAITKKADIIISAVGKPNVVKPDSIKKGVILISVGLHKGEDGKLHGDYDEEQIKDIASYYTPTPGGVGPVNVAMLLENLVKATELS